MKVKCVLFDLDGTLLPMDQDEFFKKYFGLLTTKMAPYGYDPQKLVKSVWHGVVAMSSNNGTRTNEDVFWDSFVSEHGEAAFEHKGVFEDFYKNEFQNLKKECGRSAEAVELVKLLKKKGIKTVVATKPIFPDVAIRSRISWAGFSVDDFEIYTTYEKFYYCKPNPMYYKEIAEKIGVLPEECLMVGNDVAEDMTAAEAGMNVFLLTDCLINEKGADITGYQKGSFCELEKYIETLI